jgi:CheY-like chemotaxis protein
MYTILIVDDDAVVRELLQEAFKAKGWFVATAEDGARGFELAERIRPSLIVMDIMMPSVYGTSAAKRLQEESATSRIPIVVYSSVDAAKAKTLLPEGPRVRFVGKTEGLDRLRSVVIEMLQPAAGPS